MFRRLTITAIALAGSLALSGCGFTPLYATRDDAGRAGLSGVKLADVAVGETTRPILTRAFERRLWRESDETPATYDLVVKVRESAQQLAVQIDASVTRFNYRMRATYTMTKRSDGSVITGAASSQVSFNVVSSQYSTVFAEKSARENAARVLVEEIERDILLKLAAAREKQAVQTALGDDGS